MTDRSAALAVSTLAAVVTALPAVPRVSDAGAGALLGFSALFGGTALVLGPALLLAGATRAGAASFRTPLLGFALAATPLSLLAEGLMQRTHHRPLGAATFALLALATVAGAMLVAWRVLRFSESGGATARRVVFGLAVLVAVFSLGLVLVRALSAPALVPHVLDGLRAFAAATLCHLLLRFPRMNAVLGRIGAPLWVLVVAVGFFANRGATGAAVRSAAPVLGGPQAWL